MVQNISSKYGHWEVGWDFNPEDYIGFTYLITCLKNGRRYIGKKFFTSTSHTKKKSSTRRKKVVKESNWKTYSGSSQWLQSEIALYGKENFRFEITSLHESRSSLAWEEGRRIVLCDALRSKLPNGEKSFYNGILCQIRYAVKDSTPNELSHNGPLEGWYAYHHCHTK